MLSKLLAVAALCAAGLTGFAFDPPEYNGSFTRQGVSYAQRGGLGARDYVVTNIVVNGQPRPLPPYLYLMELDDTYPDDAEWYYQQIRNADGGHCSVRRNGNAVERNYDWHFDDAATFVLKVGGAEGRFASVGVANVGTNLTDSFVRSGEWSRYYKCLAGHTLDGINENGLVAEVNVTSGSWGRTSGAVHGSGAVRWALDHGTNAQQAAEFLAANVYLPQDFGLNLHYLIADKTKTYIVENCEAHEVTNAPAVMTNFSLDRQGGEGYERYASLTNGATIESQWWTLAYNPATRPVRSSDLGGEAEQIWAAWNDGRTKEQHRGESFGGVTWWQTVHCSKYDIPTLTLRIAVQETDDWYVFALSTGGGGKVKSVNGKVGEVTLHAEDVGAVPTVITNEVRVQLAEKLDILPNGSTNGLRLAVGGLGMVANVDGNVAFKVAGQRSLADYGITNKTAELPSKWALANVTNANGGAVGADDVGAIPAMKLSGGVYRLGDVNLQIMSSGDKTFIRKEGVTVSHQEGTSQQIAQYGNDRITRYDQALTDKSLMFPDDGGTLATEEWAGDILSDYMPRFLSYDNFYIYGTNTQGGGFKMLEVGSASSVGSRNIFLGVNPSVSRPSDGSGVVSVGNAQTLGGRNITAVGNRAETTGYSQSNEGVIIGYNTKIEGLGAIAVGSATKAQNAGALALGYVSTASGSDSIAIGYGAEASDNDSIVIGANAYSHGSGTFNIPQTSLSQFYFGSKTLKTLIDAEVPTNALDIADVEKMGRYLGVYSNLGSVQCRTDMAVGDIIYVRVGTAGQYATIKNAKQKGDVLGILDTTAIPSADFQTRGFNALLAEPDKTLTVEGRPADAKAVGDALADIQVPDEVLVLDGGAVKTKGGATVGAGAVGALQQYNPVAAKMLTITNENTTLNPEVRLTRRNANGTTTNLRIVQTETAPVINHSTGGGDWDIKVPSENGTIALRNSLSLEEMLVDANTNQTAHRECISTNIFNLAAPAITNAVIYTRDRFYDAELDVTWKRTVSGGRIFYDIEAVGNSTED